MALHSSTLLHGAMALVLLSGCGKPTRGQTTIPFDLRKGLVVVSAEIGGKRASLILDTGSGAALLDSTFAEDITVLWSPIRANAIGAAASSVKMGWVGSIGLGSAKVVRPMIVASQLLGVLKARVGADIQGTLGYDVFDQYVVTIDYVSKSVTFTRPSEFHYAGGGIEIPITIESRIPALDATVTTRTVGTLPLHLSVDIGAIPCVLHLSKRFVDAHDLTHDTTTVTSALAAGLGVAAQPGEFLRLRDLSIQGLHVLRPTTELVREPSGSLGSDSRTDGSIGAELFQQSRLTIDYPGKRLYVEHKGGVEASRCVSYP